MENIITLFEPRLQLCCRLVLQELASPCSGLRIMGKGKREMEKGSRIQGEGEA